jgi:hypothetical protein
MCNKVAEDLRHAFLAWPIWGFVRSEKKKPLPEFKAASEVIPLLYRESSKCLRT